MAYSKIKKQFTIQHALLIGGVFLFIGGVAVAKNWNNVTSLLTAKSRNTTASENATSLYYPYVPPTVPKVLGDDTAPDGPGVLNEDGTISNMQDLGSVLGAASTDVQVDINTISVRSVPDTTAGKDAYWSQTYVIESVITPGDFEALLVSNNQAAIDKQVQTMRSVQEKLKALAVPQAMVKLHKLKIVQYDVAIDLLTNFYQADSNAEYVSAKLAEFMRIQQEQETESQLLLP